MCPQRLVRLTARSRGGTPWLERRSMPASIAVEAISLLDSRIARHRSERYVREAVATTAVK